MANFKTVGDWSTTAGSNSTVDSNNIAENCAFSGINNAIRAVMAGAKGALTSVSTAGTDTYTATLAPVPDGYATGQVYLLTFASVNTSTTPTINLNTLGAKTIVQRDGSTALVAGDLNGIHWIEYDGTNMRLINPAKFGSVNSIADATNGGLNFSAATGAVTANIKPSDLLTKATPTTSDSIVIMDAAASSAAKTSTLPAVVGALFSPITNSLGGSVSLNNTGTFFDGPSVAQGSTGTWFASGNVTVTDSAGAAGIIAKLWDGTTVIASAESSTSGAGTHVCISLSGFIASPQGNIKISVKDASSTSGSIENNVTGGAKDSTVTAIRIA